MNIFLQFFAKKSVRIITNVVMLGIIAVLSLAFINTKVSMAQSSGGPTAGQRFTLFNSGGGQTLTKPLGNWAFCMIVEHNISETSGDTNDYCRLDGNLNSDWTLVSLVGKNQNGQCSAFCVRW